MPDTNKNRKAVAGAAKALVEAWHTDFFSPLRLQERENALITAVEELQR